MHPSYLCHSKKFHLVFWASTAKFEPFVSVVFVSLLSRNIKFNCNSEKFVSRQHSGVSHFQILCKNVITWACLKTTVWPCWKSSRPDRQCRYKRNIYTRLHNHIISITYSECVSVALVTQYAKRMRQYYTVSCGTSGCTIFLHILINGTIFVKILLNEKRMFWFSIQIFLKIFSF